MATRKKVGPGGPPKLLVFGYICFSFVVAKHKFDQDLNCKRSMCVRVSVNENLVPGQSERGYLVDGC